MNKKYDINYYSKEKAIKREKYFDKHPLFYNKGTDTNKFFFDNILQSLDDFKKSDIKMLDLGTGCGYVPEILCKLTKRKLNITGIDLSENMINNAKTKVNDKRVKFLLADNENLPFDENNFDIVTDKLSTQINIKEIFRVLKPDGFFIFKEYGCYKGFKEIYQIFQNRFKKIEKSPVDYYQELHKLNFQEIILRTFLLKRKYNLNEIKDIFEMSNIIYNFSESDLKTIQKKLFKNNFEVTITSDPFIIFAKK